MSAAPPEPDPAPTPASLSFTDIAGGGQAGLTPAAQDLLGNADRARFVSIDTAAVTAALQSGQVDIELFPGTVFTAETTQTLVPGVAGTTHWFGNLTDGGTAAATVDANGLQLILRSPQGSFDLQTTSAGTALIAEDGRQFPPESSPQIAPAGDAPIGGGDVQFGDEADPDPIGGGAAVSTQRVLTIYDRGARTYFGGDAAAQSQLAATLNEMNAAYAASGVEINAVNAGIEFVDVTAPSDTTNALDSLTGTADGFLDTIHQRRVQVGADLVVLITDNADFCGYAWLFNNSAAYGFSVVTAACARGNLSYAHEIGHNQGAGHGYFDGGGIHSYSNGYRDLTRGFRTILAYPTSPSTTRVARFSSATLLYNGFPSGTATNDNARTLNETAAAIAAFVGTPAASTPSVPRTLTATPGPARVALSWLVPTSAGTSPITDYRVFRSTDGVTFTLVPDGVSTATTATITGLTPGTLYQFRVRAVNASGASAYSNTATAAPTAVGPTVPAVPASLTATAPGPYATLTWGVPSSNGGSPLTDYRIFRSTDGVNFTLVPDGVSLARTTTVTGLTPGVTYQFRVRAVNAIGVSAFSNTATATPGTGPVVPTAPTSLTATVVGGNVVLNWPLPGSDGGSPLTDYRIFRSTDGVNFTLVPDGVSLARTTTVTGLTPGVTYQFRVRAVNTTGASAYSPTAIATP